MHDLYMDKCTDENSVSKEIDVLLNFHHIVQLWNSDPKKCNLGEKYTVTGKTQALNEDLKC